MRVLYVDIDSLRPDHLGCYGYGRPTSPVIDGIAAQGVRFTRYSCSDSPCLPSRAACFSGRPGIRNGVVTHEDQPLGNVLRYGPAERYGGAPLLMHHLMQAGLTTVGFSSFADRHLAGWFHLGFRRFNVTSLKGGHEDADEVNAVALPWLREHAAEDDWFVHLNYWDPHVLYTAPAPYVAAMAAHPAPAWPDAAAIAAQQPSTGVRSAGTLWMLTEAEGWGSSRVPTMPDRIGERADFELLMSGYDAGIRYADEHLGVVLDELARQGVLDETAIIVSADHGEAFGELGQYIEHATTSPAVHQIPLVVRWPGLTDGAAGTARDDLLLNLDLAPTLAEALGLQVPPGWTGRSFRPLLGGKDASDRREAVYWGHGLHTRQRAVNDGRFLYVRTYHPGLYLYPPRMLFDLDSDPHLTDDLADRLPVEVNRLDAMLRAWEEEQVAATGRPDPLRQLQAYPPYGLSPLDRYLERLRRAGRSADAARLAGWWDERADEFAPAPLGK